MSTYIWEEYAAFNFMNQPWKWRQYVAPNTDIYLPD
jgi:hypothetical protein